jgi:hypothetical protein
MSVWLMIILVIFTPIFFFLSIFTMTVWLMAIFDDLEYSVIDTKKEYLLSFIPYFYLYLLIKKRVVKTIKGKFNSLD